ncbi:hypothetical protein SAMN05444392_11067 [Seinonella peptonophila]|uniref:Uncharacterized protein n=1 Tax=Seinonella peptonophila TaxID=112248 RepID=A0A1M4ZRB8_9BACL|nr:hypothetical protein SAMN05444392_11067 [Seinonella peptonophila]
MITKSKKITMKGGDHVKVYDYYSFLIDEVTEFEIIVINAEPHVKLPDGRTYLVKDLLVKQSRPTITLDD